MHTLHLLIAQSQFLKKAVGYTMQKVTHTQVQAFVINRFRPLTSTVEDTVEIMREIEAAAGIRFNCIVNNSNIGTETTADTVLESVKFAEELSLATGLPIWLHTVEKDIAKEISGIPILPLKLQKKYFDLPD